MGFFDKRHEKDTPMGELRAHIGKFMYFVQVGKSKFKHKNHIGIIFEDMDSTQYLFQQATSGSLYDYKKKLDYTLWDAALHKYHEDMEKLKAELLKAVDESHLQEEDEEEAVEEIAAEESSEESLDWKSDLKGQLERAAEEAKERKEKRQEEREAKRDARHSKHMTEEDCRELWRIIQGLERELNEAKDIADEWFQVHGKKNGCFAALLVLAMVPASAVYGVVHFL